MLKMMRVRCRDIDNVNIGVFQKLSIGTISSHLLADVLGWKQILNEPFS